MEKAEEPLVLKRRQVLRRLTVPLLWCVASLEAQAFLVVSSALGKRRSIPHIPHYYPRIPFGSRKRDMLSQAPATTDALLVDTAVWESYDEVMRDIMARNKVTKKQQEEDLRQVQDYILSNRPWIETLSSLVISADDALDAADYKDVVLEQRSRFCNATDFSKVQMEYLTRCLSYVGDSCARLQSNAPARVAWLKIRESGILPRENTVSTFMYILSLSQDTLEACLDVASFHDLLFEPNEKTITLRIKSLIAQGDAASAENVLQSLPCKGKGTEGKRLRTFSPILSHYCESGEMGAALRLFRQMRESEGVLLDAETYALLIAALARRGCFRPDANPIGDVVDYGFSVSSGPILFDELAAEMAEDILELTETSADAIAKGFADAQPSMDIHLGRTTVNATTALCPETGVKLRLFRLSEPQRSKVHDKLLEMAAVQHEQFGQKLRSRGKPEHARGGQYAYNMLCKFSDWLKTRDGERFTAIIDGPNVAYFARGNVHYSQVQLVVDELERLGERPLVVMPEKYVSSSFRLAGLGYTQKLSENEIDIMTSLIDSEKLYTVPTHCLDDYYWMIASVSNQTRDISESCTGELPGLRPLLITNDQMRDHRLSLLEPRLFRRWTSCHIVNYDIKSYDRDEWESREVRFSPADVLSREIQGNPDLLRGKGLAWHFPVTEWPEPARFYVLLER